MMPASRQISSEVCTVSTVSRRRFAPRCCATSTFTPLPRPIRKPVNSETSIEVEPTEPSACALAKLPTTATSAMLKVTCNICDIISGMLKRNIFRQSEPCVMSILL